VISHDEARALINDAFNALTQRALDRKWDPDAIRTLAERRRQVLEYMEHLKRTAENKETRA
jgi:hypothetical protein